MHLLLKLLIIFFSLGIGLLHADNKVNKVATKTKSQHLFETSNELNTSEIEEIKKTANYFKALIAATQDVGVQNGHEPTREQELVIMDTLFPFTKEDALKKGEIRVNFSLKCFSKANTLQSANLCNTKANTLSHLIVKDFQDWDNIIKIETLKHLKQYIPCLENSKTTEELSTCYMHIYK